MQIIVLGMHRSGTSVVARLLNMMGAYFAPEKITAPEKAALPLTEANPKGYWERWDVFSLNEDILRTLEISWDNISQFSPTDITPEIQIQFESSAREIIFGLDANRPWMMKDPRLCLLLPLWRSLLEIPVCVYVYRSPIQVAQSLKKREGFPFTLGFALWEKYNLHGLTNSTNMPKILISHEELINDPVATVKKLHQQLLDFEVQGLRLPSDKEIRAFIDAKLFHEKGDLQLQNAYINLQQAILFDAFENGSIFQLDPLPELSEGAAEILEGYRNKIAAKQEALELQQKIIDRDEQIAQYEQEITNFQKQLADYQADYQEQVNHYQKQWQSAENQVKQKIALINHNLLDLSNLQTRFADKEHELSILADQVEHQHLDIQRLMYWISALDGDIAAVFNSLTWHTGNLFTQLALKLTFRKAGLTAQDHIRATLQEVAEYPFYSVSEHQLPRAMTQQLAPKIDDEATRRAFRPPALILPDKKAYQLWYKLNQCQSEELEQQQREVQKWHDLPLISIVLPLFNSQPNWLDTLLSSIHIQTYPLWECILVDDASTTTNHLSVVEKWCQKDSRFRLVKHPQNKGVGSTSQTGVENAKGTYLCVVDHDDQLEPQALFEVAKVIREYQSDVIYSDEMLINEDGSIIRCVFRPDFNYYFLLSHPYIVHITVIRRDLLIEVGGFKRDLTVSQDYDLLLRVAASTQSFFHIPKVLYRWRTYKGSTGHQQAHNVMSISQAAINEHLRLKGFSMTEAWAMEGFSFNFFRIRYKIEPVKVSVIIPTKDKVDLLRSCIESVQQKTFFPEGVELEFLIVDNGSTEQETLSYFEELKSNGHHILNEPGHFNFSLLNNKGVAQTSGALLLFMNNDIEVIEAGWLEAMLELMAPKEVAVVGAKLLYPDGLIQHAGVMMGVNGPASHDHQFFPELEHYRMAGGHNHALLVIRECLAVTAACMLVRRSAFDAVDGFDEKLEVGFGDTDLCLRLHSEGYKCLFTPYARLIHYESASRGYHHGDPHPADRQLFYSRWNSLIERGDPFYNPNLKRTGKMFEPLLDQ